jgi:hypothetical protein
MNNLLSRYGKVAASVKLHAFEVPQHCGFVRCVAVPAASKAGAYTRPSANST